jgi:hypothetical protein
MSAPLRTLTELSGWAWPATTRLDDLVAELVTLSQDWDFRRTKERGEIETGPLHLAGRAIGDDVVIAAARELGFVDAAAPPESSYSHVVVLGGAARACVNRARRAADLVHNGLRAGTLVALSAHRRLSGRELADLDQLGLAPQMLADGHGDVSDEAQIALLAQRDAFGLPEPEQFWPQPTADLALLLDKEFYAASARYSWPSLTPPADVVIAPSGDPAQRRANTADQLGFWAELAEVGPEDSILLVTTQIYVPPQQIDAVRVLGRRFGCAVTTCGVDARTVSLPIRDFGARDYLQEVRSTLLAAASLLRTGPPERVQAG